MSGGRGARCGKGAGRGKGARRGTGAGLRKGARRGEERKGATKGGSSDRKAGRRPRARKKKERKHGKKGKDTHDRKNPLICKIGINIVFVRLLVSEKRNVVAVETGVAKDSYSSVWHKQSALLFILIRYTRMVRK